jgi:hypothetical protein
MAQRVCVVVDSAERGLLPDDCHRRACSSFSILHGGKTGLPVHVNPGHDPGGPCHGEWEGWTRASSSSLIHP